MIKAIIFDLDRVLVDATGWHYEALNKALGLFVRFQRMAKLEYFKQIFP